MELVAEIRRNSSTSPWTYALLDQRQREIAARIRAGGEGAVLLSEVAPVVTLGRRTKADDLLLSEELFNKKGIPLHRTDRGGLATYHGPGQWVLFVVERLDRLTGDSRGVRAAVCGLLEVARKVGEKYTPSVEIRDGLETGVWCDLGKFAAVGVHIEDRVLLHGLAINGFATPESFAGIRPCGLDAPVAYLLKNPSEFEALGQDILRAVQTSFNQNP